MIKLLTIAFLWLAFCTQSFSAESVRLAIVVESSDASSAADTLTVTLSKSSGLTLLERDQVQKVYQEQALAAGSRDYVKLGQILGADGLLLLSIAKQADPQVLSARLIAVKPGAVLSQTDYRWPLPDPAEWSGLATRQFQPLFPKLSVLPKDALPISILNLRSALTSPEAQALDRELTLLLHNRLVKEKDIFVLERRRLELLAEEKELAFLRESSFWNGSYLVEGVIDKDGVSPTMVTVSARLVPPDKKDVITLDISGARTNLSAIVNELATRILNAVKKGSGSAEWNPAAEAEQYFTEAKWMFKWGMLKEAQAAVESAWALGKQTSDVAELRIRVYYESGGGPGVCRIENEARRVTFGGGFNPTVGGAKEVPALAQPSNDDRYNEILRAAELYAEAFRTFVAHEPKLEAKWLDLGTGLLDRCSWWLRYYYFTVEARAGMGDRISEGKRLVQTIVGALAGHPGFADADTKHVLLAIRAGHSAFWVETPEAGTKNYRVILAAGQWPLVRTRFLNATYFEERLDRLREGISRQVVSDAGPPSDSASPCLAGWKWQDRIRADQVWTAFVEELCRDPNPLNSLEGMYLRCSYSWSEEEYERNLKSVLGSVWDKREELQAASLSDGWLADLRTLVERRSGTVNSSRRKRINDETWVPFEKKFGALKRIAWLEERKNYLRTTTNFDVQSFTTRVMYQTYPANEAEQLLPLLGDYKARVEKGGKRSDSEKKTRDYYLGLFEQRLRNAIGPSKPAPPAPSTNVVASINPNLPPTAPRPFPLARSTQRVEAQSANILHADRFWSIPEARTGELSTSLAPRIVSCNYREGKLWLELRYEDFPVDDRVDFASVDLGSPGYDTVQFIGEGFGVPDAAGRCFEVFNGYFYVCSYTSVHRYDLKTRKWELFSLPAAGHARAVRLRDRLFFTTDTSVLEYTADGSFRVLASTRRQPAQTILDALDSLALTHSFGVGVPDLFLAGDGVLHAAVRGGVYAYSAVSNNWWHAADLPGGEGGEVFCSDDGLLARHLPTYEDGELWAMDAKSSALSLLLRQPPRQMSLGYRPPKPTPAPRWPQPKGIQPVSFSPCRYDGALWLQPGMLECQSDADGVISFKDTNGCHISLIRFAETERDPLTLPIRFTLDTKRLTATAKRQLTINFLAQLLAQWTPQGLVLSRRCVPGFWHIPKSELETAIARAQTDRRAEQEASVAAREKLRRELLAKYDVNHNGIFEPAEKEAMIDDSRYLELKFANIDTNSNGVLDVEELVFFDANNNGVLEPKEYVAIEKAEAICSAKVMEKLDPNNNGKVDVTLIETPNPPHGYPLIFGVPGPYAIGGVGQSRMIDEGQLRSILRQRLSRSLPSLDRRPEASPFGIPPLDSPQTFTARVEAYWKSPSSNAARTNSPASQPQASRQ